MHWVSEFMGDENELYKHAQHHLYNYLLFSIFDESRKVFLKCDLVCEKLTVEEHNRLETHEFIDHRTLQNCHDMIAAGFRFQNRDNQLKMDYDIPDLTVYFNRIYKCWDKGDLNDTELVIAYHWERFFHLHLERFTSRSSFEPEFIKHVINASFINPNKPSGTASEHALVSFLQKYFEIQ